MIPQSAAHRDSHGILRNILDLVEPEGLRPGQIADSDFLSRIERQNDLVEALGLRKLAPLRRFDGQVIGSYDQSKRPSGK